MSQAELKQKQRKREVHIAESASTFDKIFVTPILDSSGTGLTGDSKERTGRLADAAKGTFMDNLSPEDQQTVSRIAANTVTEYAKVYDSLPPEEVKASIAMTMEGLVESHVNQGDDSRAKKMVMDSMTGVEGGMSGSEGITRRNHQIAMITPIVLMQATSSFVTPVPTSKDYAEIFVIDRHAGSTFGDLKKGELIDESFNGQYATMDQMYDFGVGDGSKTEFEFNIKDLSINEIEMPVRAGYIRIYHDLDLVAQDKSGDGLINGTFSLNGKDILVTSVSAANYDTGVFKIKFSVAPAAGVVIRGAVDIDLEKAPQLIPTIEHKMKSFIVKPHEAAITANESIQAVFAARREYGLEMRSMQMMTARNVLAAEKDRRRLNTMWKFASRHYEWARIPKDALSHAQHYADLKEFFGGMSIQMVQDTHKSGIKGMFLGLEAMNLVMNAPGFKARPGYRPINQPHFVGRLGECEIHCDPQADSWSGLAIGKGESYGDSAFIAADAISAIHYQHGMGAPGRGHGKGMVHQDTFYELAFRDIHPYRGRKYLFTFTFTNEKAA